MQDQRPLSPTINIISDQSCDPVAISNPTLDEMLIDRYEQEGRIDKRDALSLFLEIVRQNGPDEDRLDPDEDDDTVWNKPDRMFPVEADHNPN